MKESTQVTKNLELPC